MFNKISSEYWIPYSIISIDDDMWRFMGLGGPKVKIDNKEAKVGIISWKACDEKRFVFAMVFTDSLKVKNLMEEKLLFNEAVLRTIEQLNN